MTADPARIRRVNREFEFALVRDDSVLAARPDARPAGDDAYVIDSLFDSPAVAQRLLEEKFAIASLSRRTELIEFDEMLAFGATIPIAPQAPRIRAVDATRRLDKSMLLAGTARDFNTSRTSVEIIG